MRKDSSCQLSKCISGKIAVTLLVMGLMISCGPIKKTDQTANKISRKGPFNLQTAMQSADTAAIRAFLAGTWTLNKMCRSSFAGLKCDTTIHQSWLLDSLGNIDWITEGESSAKDQYRFLPKTGARAGTTKVSDTSWVLFLNQARRGYLIRSLTKDSLAIAEYPLIMDNTVTYFLSR